jgi:hypothetical protein
LASSPFAHHYSGNRGCFLFLWVLRCFTSPRYLHPPYVFRRGRQAIKHCQVSPFGHPRIEVWLPTPRGLSQAPTSFFGSWCQGIRRVPLITWQLQLQMLASTVQFSKYGRSRQPSHRKPRTHHSITVLTGQFGGKPVLAEETSRSPFPQDPTACPATPPPSPSVPPAPQHRCTNHSQPSERPNNQCSTMSNHTRIATRTWLWTGHTTNLMAACQHAP